MANDEEETVVKMRGLPWSASVDDILSFLDAANVKNGKAGIHMIMSREGRLSGEAFVELESPEDVQLALAKDKQNMGHRYIEVFRSSYADMEWYLNRSGQKVENVMDECCIRLRGLPYGCMEDDIEQFFAGLTIVPNGISFVSDHTGRNTGEAYVQFVNKEMVESALQKHLNKIGHRYIEIFRSSVHEIEQITSPKIRPLMSEFVPRPTPYNRGERFRGMSRFNRGSQVATRLKESYSDDWDYSSGWTAAKLGAAGSKPLFSLTSATRAPDSMHNTGSGKGFDGFENEICDNEEKFIVRMRGLPFRATEQDILAFFNPLVPINVHIFYENGGRPSGEGEVEFASYNDAENALKKDKQNMNNRYIELFLRTKPPVNNAPIKKTFLEDNTSQLFSRRPVGENSNNGGFSGMEATSEKLFIN